MGASLLRLRDVANVACARALTAFLVIAANATVLTFIVATVYVSASATRRRCTLRTASALIAAASAGTARAHTARAACAAGRARNEVGRCGLIRSLPTVAGRRVAFAVAK